MKPLHGAGKVAAGAPAVLALVALLAFGACVQTPKEPATTRPSEVRLVFPRHDARIAQPAPSFPFVIDATPRPCVIAYRVNGAAPVDVILDMPAQRVDVPVQPGENEVVILARDVANGTRTIATRRIRVVAADAIDEGQQRAPKDDEPAAPPAPDLAADDEAVEFPSFFTFGMFGCLLDVDVCRPISQDNSEPLISEGADFSHGAFTLRNDDTDWRIGNDVPTDQLPVAAVATDLDRQPNDRENDLVRVDALNIFSHDEVFLFAFALDAEDDRNLETTVDPQNGVQATAAQLAVWRDAKKTAAGPAFPIAVPSWITSVWVEGLLGGRYRLVIGILPEGTDPADVVYDVATKKTVPELLCMRQATLTVVVVDIFQRTGQTQRLSAFDVYWGGRPHFRAEAWPGGGAFEWATPYKLGPVEHRPPGIAADGRVGAMERDTVDDEPGSPGTPEVAGTQVTARGAAPAGNKARFDGGLVVNRPVNGDQPIVSVDPADRYPERISVAYTIDNERLVRHEPLAVILPQLGGIPAAPLLARGNRTRVRLEVPYSIVDGFGRRITAPSVKNYVALYGAGLKSWEALTAVPGQIAEAGHRNDDVTMTNVPAGTPPLTLGTSQRSRAAVRNDRMTAGAFQDTLQFESTDAGLWSHWTGNTTPQARQATVQEAAQRRQAIQNGGGAAVAAADATRITSHVIFSLPQDVILQLRFGDERQDIHVLRGNMLTLYAPYFSNNHAGFVAGSPPFSYHMQFTPGTLMQSLVDTNHRRTPP